MSDNLARSCLSPLNRPSRRSRWRQRWLSTRAPVSLARQRCLPTGRYYCPAPWHVAACGRVCAEHGRVKFGGPANEWMLEWGCFFFERRPSWVWKAGECCLWGCWKVVCDSGFPIGRKELV